MQDKDRERRRSKRLQKQKKKRASVSRPAAGGTVGGIDVAKGRSWEPGECYVSEGADEPGAEVELVFSRSRPDGISVVSTFEIDRSGPGIVACRSVGGLRREQVVGECARLSERTGRSMVGCEPGVVVGFVNDARAHGTNPAPAGLSDALGLLDDLSPVEPVVPFGPAVPEAEAAPDAGWLGGLRRRLFGS